MQLNDNHAIWQQVFDVVKNQWQELTAPFTDEMLLTISENQVNDALYNFVTKNVQAILDMHINFYDGWFQLSATVNAQGVFARVSSNFRLVQIQLDRQRQRLVFAQISDTEILELHSTSYIKSKGIALGVKAYRRLLNKDPLGLILSKINLARTKDNVLYIDIGRWLKKNQKIMNALYKFQVNTAHSKPKQLILQAHVNYRDLLATNASGDIITEADAPHSMEQEQQSNEPQQTDTAGTADTATHHDNQDITKNKTNDSGDDKQGIQPAPAPKPNVDINPAAKPIVNSK